MTLTNYINFKKLVTIIDDSSITNILMAPNEKINFVNEKIPKNFLDQYIDLIEKSSNLQYIESEDIYLKPCVDNYENICIEKNNEKNSKAPQLCEFLNEYDPSTNSSDSDDTNSSDSDDTNSNNETNDNSNNIELKKNLFFKSIDKSIIFFYIDLHY